MQQTRNNHFKNLLELELDDWLDPSLPSMFCKELLESEIVRVEAEAEPFELCPPFTTEFTNENLEFATTSAIPPLLPVCMLAGQIILTRREETFIKRERTFIKRERTFTLNFTEREREEESLD
jgi:hypothetical protein